MTIKPDTKSCETITDAVNVPEHGPEVVALSVEPVALSVEPAVADELAFAAPQMANRFESRPIPNKLGSTPTKPSFLKIGFFS